MNTIEHYLKQLDYYRKLLITNLRNLGIECDDDEKYNTLIPKIYSLTIAGEIVVDDFSLCEYDGSEEDVNYILEHIITTNEQTDMQGKFYNTPNLKTLALNKFVITENTKNIQRMFSTSTTGVTTPVVSVDASNSILTNESGFRQNTTSYTTLDKYASLTDVILDNSTICNSMLALFTCVGTAGILENISMDNMVYDSSYFKYVFGTYGNSSFNTVLKNLDMSKVIYNHPISAIDCSFSNLKELETVDLGDFEFADTVTFGSFMSASNYGYSGFKDLYKLKTLLFPLSKLENRTINRFEFANARECSDDIIFPIITITDKSQPLLLNDLKKVKKCDLTNITFTNNNELSTMDYCYCFEGMGSTLTEEELTDGYFKWNQFDFFNGVRINRMTNMFSSNKLINEDIDLSNIIISPSGANYNNFFSAAFSSTNITKLTIDNPTIMSYTKALGGYDMCSFCKKLKEVYIKLGRCNVNFTGLVTAASNLEKLYISVDECTTAGVDAPLDVSNILCYTSSSIISPEAYDLTNLKEIIFENTRINGLPSTNPTINKSRTHNITPNLEKIEFINCVFTGISMYLFMYCYQGVSFDFSTLDASTCTTIYYAFAKSPNLTNLNFCTNLGKYFTAKANMHWQYILDLSESVLLTQESLMDVINKLYDLNITYGVYDEEGNPGTGTLYTQKLILGETNLTKLTPEEIAIATNKGWTVS